MAFEHVYHVAIDVIKHFFFTLLWKLDKCSVGLVLVFFFQFLNMLKLQKSNLRKAIKIGLIFDTSRRK